MKYLRSTILAVIFSVILSTFIWIASLGFPLIGLPEIESLTYHLTDGRQITIEANQTTMWWHGHAHPVREPDVFVNIIQGLFFDLSN